MTVEEKIKEIREGKNLYVHLNDSDSQVREAVARNGYGLDKLIDDSNVEVVRVVAEKYKQMYEEGRG